jgi:transposase InsO family protein
VISWSIGTRSDAELVNTMLDAAIEAIGSSNRPVVHSDRGAHYRWPGWLTRIREANLTRSMSRKGCSPDNAACKGFFGPLKTELFYPRDWQTVSTDQFIEVVDSYIRCDPPPLKYPTVKLVARPQEKPCHEEVAVQRRADYRGTEGSRRRHEGRRPVPQTRHIGCDVLYWRSRYGGMDVSEARRLRQLEEENQRLKQLVADQALDIQVLKDVLGKK